MKKFLSLILCLCILSLVTGCGETKDNSEKISSKNNSVHTESKIESNQDMQVQTPPSDNADIDTKIESEDKCLLCDNTIWMGSAYCSMHKCSRSGCDDARVKYERFCRYHKCGNSDCGNQNSIDSTGGSPYCPQHTCAEFGCVNQVTSGGYCANHANG